MNANSSIHTQHQTINKSNDDDKLATQIRRVSCWHYCAFYKFIDLFTYL